jgi:hypothetical protein
VQWTRSGDSGKKVTNNYCANCHTLMHVEIEAMPDIDVYKAGKQIVERGSTNDDMISMSSLALPEMPLARSRHSHYFCSLHVGTLDDKAFDNATVVQEIYTRNRPCVLESLKNAEQKEAA